MRRFIVCAVFVLVLTFTVLAFGEGVDMIGKQVDATYPLYINGGKAAKEAISIEGTSYIPVRVASEMFGYDVEFANNEVKLSRKGKVIPHDYEVHSDIIKIGGNPEDKHSYILRDGEGYLPLIVFAHYCTYEDTKATINVPDYKTIIINNGETYEPGINGFVNSGRIVVKLSAVGLKGVVKDGVLWLEKL